MLPKLETDHLVDHVLYHLRRDGTPSSIATAMVITASLAALRRLCHVALTALERPPCSH